MSLAAPVHVQIRALFAVSAAFLASALDSSFALRNLQTYALERPMLGQEAFIEDVRTLGELFVADASGLERRSNTTGLGGDDEHSPTRKPWMRQTRWAKAVGDAIPPKWIIGYVRNHTRKSREAAREANKKRKGAKVKHVKQAKQAKTVKEATEANATDGPTSSLAALTAEQRTAQQHSSVSWDSGNSFYWVLFFCMFTLFFVTQYRSLQTVRDYQYGYLYRFIMYIGLAMVFGIIVDAEDGLETGISWASGYMIELTFSLENILLFHTIIEQFQVPPRNTSKALFIVMQVRIMFQAWLYLGLADAVEKIHWIPFVLGSVLVYMGVSMLVGHGASEHALRDYRDSIVTRVFRWAFGDRFLLHYDMHLSIFVRDDIGKWYVTLLAPVIIYLLAVDMCFEIDVTLLKIEDCDNHFVAFTSSALAAFAVPEMYAIVRKLFEQFYLLKHALGVIIIFFGIDLLCEEWFQISDIAALSILAFILISSMLVSWIFNLGPGEKISEQEEDQSADLLLLNSEEYSEDGNK